MAANGSWSKRSTPSKSTARLWPEICTQVKRAALSRPRPSLKTYKSVKRTTWEDLTLNNCNTIRGAMTKVVVNLGDTWPLPMIMISSGQHKNHFMCKRVDKSQVILPVVFIKLEICWFIQLTGRSQLEIYDPGKLVMLMMFHLGHCARKEESFL